MSTQLITMTTLQDLVDQVLMQSSRLYGKPDTYALIKHIEQEYVDAAAGTAWDKADSECREKFALIAKTMREANPDSHNYISYDDVPGYQEERAIHLELRPDKHSVAHYYLDPGHHNSILVLAAYLGAMVETVYKKNPRWTNQFLGRMTLAGIAKRLGATGLDKEVKAAQTAAAAAAAINSRNRARRNLRDALEKLGDAVAAGKKTGLFSGVDPAEVKLGIFDVAIGNDE